MTEFNISFNLDGEEKKKKTKIKIISLDDVVKWIKKQGYDKNIEDGLIKKAKGLPAGYYHQFPKDIKKHIKSLKF